MHTQIIIKNIKYKFHVYDPKLLFQISMKKISNTLMIKQ